MKTTTCPDCHDGQVTSGDYTRIDGYVDCQTCNGFGSVPVLCSKCMEPLMDDDTTMCAVCREETVILTCDCGNRAGTKADLGKRCQDCGQWVRDFNRGVRQPADTEPPRCPECKGAGRFVHEYPLQPCRNHVETCRVCGGEGVV